MNLILRKKERVNDFFFLTSRFLGESIDIRLVINFYNEQVEKKREARRVAYPRQTGIYRDPPLRSSRKTLKKHRRLIASIVFIRQRVCTRAKRETGRERERDEKKEKKKRRDILVEISTSLCYI